MKLSWIAEWKCNEVEGYAWAATIMFIGLFLVTTFWDSIAGVQINHHQGYGWRQIVVMAVFGIFSVWGMLVAVKWGE